MLPTRIATMMLAACALFATSCGQSLHVANQNATPIQKPVTVQSQHFPATPQLTSAKLVAAADPLCAALTARRAMNKIRTKSDYIHILEAMSPYEQQIIGELSALTPPATLSGAWKTILANYKTIAANLRQITQYMTEKHEDAAAALLEKSNMLARTTAAIARRHGFKDCGQTS